MRHLKKHPMFPIFLVVFLGYVGFSLAFPIFSPMFMDPSHKFFPPDLSLKIRTTLLGLVLAAYPLGQFLGLPLLGQLSDVYGRKKVLSISLCFTLVSYIGSAVGIMIHSFWLLLISRFICGYAEGNFSIAQSSAADISTGHKRVKNFGLINMAASLGFVIGPVLGGKLADPNIVSWFDDDIPFWFSAILALFTILMVLWQLPNTKARGNKKLKSRLHPFSGLILIFKNFSRTSRRGLYLINFMFYFGLFFFYQYFPVLLVKRFNFTSSKIADISAYGAVILAVSQLAIVHPLAKRLNAKKAATIGAFILAPALIGLTVKSFNLMLFLFLPLACVAMALSTTNLQSVVSHSATEKLQGEVMGVNYSMQILGEVITSAVGGFLAGFFIVSLPLVLGGVVVFLAAMALLIFTPKDSQPLH